MVESSILDDVKSAIGINMHEGCTEFDTELIMQINSAFFTLNQLGVGPEQVFSITGSDSKWEDFVYGRTDLDTVRLYVIYKVRLGFDPPSNAYLVEAIKNNIAELEWRLNVHCDESILQQASVSDNRRVPVLRVIRR